MKTTQDETTEFLTELLETIEGGGRVVTFSERDVETIHHLLGHTINISGLSHQQMEDLFNGDMTYGEAYKLSPGPDFFVTKVEQ